jgi:hypothetical protein
VVNTKSKFELVWFRVRAEKQAVSVLRGSRFRNLLYFILTGSVVATPGIGGSSVGRGCV